jgi:hypothetical protein
LGAAGTLGFAQEAQSNAQAQHQPLRIDAPVAAKVDVLVCGGGPAGCAAALYAARSGAKTLLLENLPFLGGVWTAVGVSHLISGRGHQGLNTEIHERLPVHQVFNRNIYVIEDMKMLLDTMMSEAGVITQFHTRAIHVVRDGSRIRGVFTASKSGVEYIEANVVIDATGDGDVAAAAGCEFEQGRPYDGLTQPVTLFGTIGGYQGEPLKGQPLVDILAKGGWKPSYPNVTVFPQPGQPGVFQLMATQFYGIDGTNVRELSRVEMQGREELRQCVQIFKEHGGKDWKDVYLISTGPAIGVRETRRIRGEYYLTWEDLDRGARFDDGITEISSGSNVHPVDNPYVPRPAGLPAPPEFEVRPYQIPYRCLVAAGVENLLTSGRCISGDCYAMGSYRLTGNVVRTGEAAGLAAAMSVEQGIMPAALDGTELVARLNDLRAEA